MAGKLSALAGVLIALSFCHSRSALEQSRQLAKAYAECTSKYERLCRELERGMKGSRSGGDMDKMVAAYARLQAEKKAALSALLSDVEERSGSDQLDLLRSRIMIEVGRLADAEKIITRLSQAGSRLTGEARLQQVIIDLIRRRYDQAAVLFKQIETGLRRDAEFFNIVVALAFSSPDAAIREEYSLKFLSSPGLPAPLLSYKARAYANLAVLARDSHRPAAAREYLKHAMAVNRDANLQASLQAEFRQLELFDRPAPPLTAETWLNSPGLTQADSQGKVVVIAFWAPWSLPCRTLMPVLEAEHRLWRDKGLLVIGCSRLYGRYGDGELQREKTSPDEELALIRDHLARKAITYPVAVSHGSLPFEAFAVSVVPTIVFINRRGMVAHIQPGAFSPQPISDLIKSLMAEKP